MLRLYYLEYYLLLDSPRIWWEDACPEYFAGPAKGELLGLPVLRFSKFLAFKKLRYIL